MLDTLSFCKGHNHFSQKYHLFLNKRRLASTCSPGSLAHPLPPSISRRSSLFLLRIVDAALASSTSPMRPREAGVTPPSASLLNASQHFEAATPFTRGNWTLPPLLLSCTFLPNSSTTICESVSKTLNLSGHC